MSEVTLRIFPLCRPTSALGLGHALPRFGANRAFGSFACPLIGVLFRCFRQPFRWPSGVETRESDHYRFNLVSPGPELVQHFGDIHKVP